MINIKPVSDLSDYSAVLQEVSVGEPAYLTENGRAQFVILDVRDYERMQATFALLSALDKGEKSGEANGWLSADELESSLGL